MNLDQTTISLQNLGQKNDELMETYEAVRNERDTKSWKLLELEKTLEETKFVFILLNIFCYQYFLKFG